jgi:hypothetical protein
MDPYDRADHPAGRRRRKTIPATCQLHRGPMGFTNLMVSKHNGSIVLDPLVTGSCASPSMSRGPGRCATC